MKRGNSQLSVYWFTHTERSAADIRRQPPADIRRAAAAPTAYRLPPTAAKGSIDGSS